ncbi:MAG: VWA domain-containing protein [Firmicutes bacterium]|nr:VWA domain-containing protein [Bacillota bacterium]
MKKNVTELVFILDRSGSMHGLEKDTLGGFNAMLEKQKNMEGEAYVSTILFNDRCVVVHDREDIKRVEPMTEEQYLVGGCTALLDALGGAIHHIGNVHKYARKSDVPQKTLFVVITDGMENASHRYSLNRVKEMIQHEQNQYGWEFLFLGANMDAVSTAGSLGIDRDRAVTYCCDEAGTALNYEAVERAVRNVRAGKKLSAEWKADIEADAAARCNK